MSLAYESLGTRILNTPTKMGTLMAIAMGMQIAAITVIRMLIAGTDIMGGMIIRCIITHTITIHIIDPITEIEGDGI